MIDQHKVVHQFEGEETLPHHLPCLIRHLKTEQIQNSCKHGRPPELRHTVTLEELHKFCAQLGETEDRTESFTLDLSGENKKVLGERKR